MLMERGASPEQDAAGDPLDCHLQYDAFLAASPDTSRRDSFLEGPAVGRVASAASTAPSLTSRQSSGAVHRSGFVREGSGGSESNIAQVGGEALRLLSFIVGRLRPLPPSYLNILAPILLPFC